MTTGGAINIAEFAGAAGRCSRSRPAHPRSHYLADQVAAPHGTDTLTVATIASIGSGERVRVDTLGAFVFIGGTPRTGWLRDQRATDDKGFLLSRP